MSGVFKAVEAEAVVNAPVEAELAPIAAPSTVPPLISGLVRVLLVNVSVPVTVARVAEASGNVKVLSAVGSVTVIVVS